MQNQHRLRWAAHGCNLCSDSVELAEINDRAVWLHVLFLTSLRNDYQTAVHHIYIVIASSWLPGKTNGSFTPHLDDLGGSCSQLVWVLLTAFLSLFLWHFDLLLLGHPESVPTPVYTVKTEPDSEDVMPAPVSWFVSSTRGLSLGVSVKDEPDSPRGILYRVKQEIVENEGEFFNP